MSHYNLYLSNNLNTFVNTYGHLLRGGDFFGDPLYIIVQNKSLGEWLKLELAERFGISANLNILLPEIAVRTIVRSFPLGRQMLSRSDKQGDKAILFMDNLKIIIYKKLEELLHTGEMESDRSKMVFRELESYVKGLGATDKDFESINSLRLYQLSDSIAGLFYFYGMNCRELTASWERGVKFFSAQSEPSMIKHEEWQMALWRELFTSESPYVHLSSILSSIVDQNDVYDGHPMKIVLFGSAFMGDSSLRFFHHLSNFLPVDHFSLSPTERVGDFSNPLLKSWGALYGGFQSLMTEKETQRAYEDPSSRSLLSQIQHQILRDYEPDDKITLDNNDKSLSIVSTTGKWREVEALKNRILKILDDNPTMNLNEIGVLAPDINEYSDFIEAVFSSEDSESLPFNIIDLSGEGDAPYISGFLMLLDLPGARFTRKELFSLFANRCFASSQKISPQEYTSWLNLCDQINIKWAVDESHKEELNIPGNRHNSWERGFDRLLEGMALSEEEDMRTAPFELFSENDTQSAGKLMHILRSLFRDVNYLTALKLRLEEWVLLWETIMDNYLSPAENESYDERDRLRIKGCFRDILNMVNDLNNLSDLENRLFDFFMFKSLLAEFINKSGGSRGRYLAQGVSCSSLKPLRAVPFKVIMVLGLNEESFPASDESLSFDLKESEEVKSIISIDLSRRSSDKYSFLEVFLSAQQRVCLFYTGRNNTDNEELQPSPLVSELAAYINDNFSYPGYEDAFDSLIEVERLQPFDSHYFTEESGLFSYDKRHYKLAEIAYDIKPFEETIEDLSDLTPIEEEEILEVTLRDLKAFIKNPLRFFFNKRCGIYLEDHVLLEEEFHENVEADFFIQRSFFFETLLASSKNQEMDIEDFTNSASARGDLINNELSIPSLDRMKDKLQKMKESIKKHQYLSSLPPEKEFLFADHTDLEKGLIKSPVYSIGEGKSIKITGALPPLYIFPDKKLLMFDLLSSSEPSYNHWISPYLTNLFLPLELRRENDLKSYLVSSEKVFELHQGPVSPHMAEKLLQAYYMNLQRPVPLYPEIAAKMINKREPETFDGKEIGKRFFQVWKELDEAPSFSYSEFEACQYKGKAYKKKIVFDQHVMTSLFEAYYVNLQKQINRSKTK